MAKLDPAILAHLEWIGFVRPTGLVVSAPALVRAGAILDRRDTEGQRVLRACLDVRTFPGEKEPAPWVPDFRAFAESVLDWSFSPKGYAGKKCVPLCRRADWPRQRLPKCLSHLNTHATPELHARPYRPTWPASPR